MDLKLLGLELLVRKDLAVVKDKSSALMLVGSTLGCDDVLLVFHRFSDHDLAILEYGSRITKYEVYGASDVATTVEVPVCLCI